MAQSTFFKVKIAHKVIHYTIASKP